MKLAVRNPRPAETTVHPLGGRRAWRVWAVGALVYLTAFFHRTSLGIAALAAQQRFDVGATVLSMFAILQLGVYMVMQIPAGVMADRFGPRRMLGAALVCLAAGEALFAVATSMPVAIIGRALVGLGDAFTFINVIRLVASWFPRQRFALLTALTAITGALGQTAGAIPLAAALRGYGWTPTFLGIAAATAALFVVVRRWVQDQPDVSADRGRTSSTVMADLRATFAQRGTRAGIWAHFSLMSSFMMLATLWGYPYLVRGLGMAPGTARLVLIIGAATPIAVAPTLGWLAGRRPSLRPRLVLSFASTLGLAWIVAVAWPGGHLPTPLAVLLILISAAGSAASMLAFDLARDANPPSRGGIASGVVNIGGFSAAMTTSLAAGALLDAAGGRYAATDFQIAFIPITCFIVIGTVRTAFLLRPERPARAERPTRPDSAGRDVRPHLEVQVGHSPGRHGAEHETGLAARHRIDRTAAHGGDRQSDRRGRSTEHGAECASDADTAPYDGHRSGHRGDNGAGHWPGRLSRARTSRGRAAPRPGGPRRRA